MNVNYVSIPDDICKKFGSYIIAYTPEIDSWFVTDERYFYYEYESEFETEQDAIDYFEKYPFVFLQISKQLLPRFSFKYDKFVHLLNNNKDYFSFLD